jgi:pimeloyl-ACP methyl ester carboxylesterase
MHYADELAKRGFICLVPDYPSYGENAYDFKKNPGGYVSGSMKAVWDNIRGIDLLETLPEVNPKRIGIIGHGLGGQSALLTAALDYRLAAVVTSSRFTTFPRYKNGTLNDFDRPQVMPFIRASFNNDPAKIPFDFGEVLGTLAPRGVFISAPLRDEVMNVDGVKNAAAAATAVYKLRNVSTLLKVTHPDVGRDFPEATRNEAYAWLEQRLKSKGGF